MKFKPGIGYIEVEPMESTSIFANDGKKFYEAAKVVALPDEGTLWDMHKGDIVFFRPHGFFELPEYNREKHYVVRVHEDIILGYVAKK